MVGLTTITLLTERVALMVSEFASYTPFVFGYDFGLGVGFIVFFYFWKVIGGRDTRRSGCCPLSCLWRYLVACLSF